MQFGVSYAMILIKESYGKKAAGPSVIFFTGGQTKALRVYDLGGSYMSYSDFIQTFTFMFEVFVFMYSINKER